MRAAKIRAILRALGLLYPEAGTSLRYRRDRFRFLVSVVLSAQCTDAKVNRVTPVLFRAFPRPTDLAEAPTGSVERILRPLGLYRVKARNIVRIAAAARAGLDWTMEGLTRLPGVGRKTANVVLSETTGRSEGIAVDTHCGRLARRLGLTHEEDPARVEKDLAEILPRAAWGRVTHLFIAHGRAVCRARAPRCPDCRLLDLCPEGQRRRERVA